MSREVTKRYRLLKDIPCYKAGTVVKHKEIWAPSRYNDRDYLVSEEYRVEYNTAIGNYDNERSVPSQHLVALVSHCVGRMQLEHYNNNKYVPEYRTEHEWVEILE